MLCLFNCYRVKDNTELTDEEKMVSEEMVGLFASLSPTFFQLKNNSITKAINLFSLDNKVSMLVMTARRHHLLYDIMNQSNTQEMALFSHIPLMVLPEV